MYDVVLFSDTNGSIGWARDAGTYTIASQLRRNGYRVKTIDFFSFFTFDTFKNAIDNFVSERTLFLGFTCTHMTTILPADLEIFYKEYHEYKHNITNVYFPFKPDVLEEWFKYATDRYPGIKTIVGGLKVAHKLRLQKSYPMVNIWVGGMADSSIVHIANDLKNNIPITKKLVKSEEEYIYAEQDFCNSSILWDKVDDTIFDGEALPLEIARGCPFNCAFCDFPKKTKNTWIKNKTTIRNELLHNYEQFGTTQYMIMDSQVNESLDKMKMVHEVFTSLPFKIEWTGFGRLELLRTHPEIIDLIYESGCKSIMWGIETINPASGEIIGKNTKLKDIEKVLDQCKAKWGDDIITGSGFVFGLPGDTIDTINELTNWLSTQPYLHSWVISPLYIGEYDPKKAYAHSFSNIQKDPAKYGYIKEDPESADWVYNGVGSDKINDMVIDFYDKSKNIRSMVAKHCYLRCTNLKFTHDELLNANLGNREWITEFIKRYTALSVEYFNRNNI